jgi:hypothetical protein
MQNLESKEEQKLCFLLSGSAQVSFICHYHFSHLMWSLCFISLTIYKVFQVRGNILFISVFATPNKVTGLTICAKGTYA